MYSIVITNFYVYLSRKFSAVWPLINLSNILVTKHQMTWGSTPVVWKIVKIEFLVNRGSPLQDGIVRIINPATDHGETYRCKTIKKLYFPETTANIT